jgi:hypothetical protein
VKLGRTRKREAIERQKRGDETLPEIVRSYNVIGWMISRRTA